MSSTPQQPIIDRRPIASRDSPIWKRLASGLAGRRVSPNMISIVGVVACVLAGAALGGTSRVEHDIGRRALWLAAAVLVQLRLLCNMLDGMVAIESGRASPVGEMYNEVPDRISDFATLVGLGYAAGGCAELGYIAACGALLVAYVRAQGKAAGAPNDFSGPMAKPHRMFVVTIVSLYLALTPAAWNVAWGTDHSFGLASVALAIIIAGCLVTTVRRLTHIAHALRTRSQETTERTEHAG